MINNTLTLFRGNINNTLIIFREHKFKNPTRTCKEVQAIQLWDAPAPIMVMQEEAHAEVALG